MFTFQSCNNLFRSGASAIALVFLLALPVQAQQILYQQNFDNPIGVNGDVYFTTDANYNGITDLSSSNGITTGGSFAGGTVLLNGIITANFNGLTPQSGGFLLGEQTQETVPDNQNSGTFFSTAGTAIPLLPNSTYRLSYYLGYVGTLALPTVTTLINGVAQGPAVTPTVAGVLQNVTYTYNSGANTNATIVLSDGTAAGHGNDYAIDSIQFSVIQAAFPLVGLDPNQTAIANNLSSGLINSVSGAVYNVVVNDPAAYPGVLDQLSPEEFGRFTSVTAFNNASFEIEAMDNYLAGERDPGGDFLTGDGNLDSSGMVVNDPGVDPALASVHSHLAHLQDSSDPKSVQDGKDMKDSKEMKSVAPAPEAKPWNVFVRGNVVLGQGFSQQDVGHFDDNTESVEVGADYRITPHFLVGIKAGYGHTDVTLDTQGSSATVDSYSPGIYASFADQGWYANLVGDYVHNAYTQDRVISFLGQTATSAPEGNEGTADLDGGYDFLIGPLTIGPMAGVEYTHLTLDSYHEGGSAADLIVNKQQDDSLRSRLGGRVSYVFTGAGMRFHPHLDAAWEHEFMDQSRGIVSQFEGTGLGSFVVRTDGPERDFAIATLGLDADITPSLTAFAEYMIQAGQSNYFGQSVQAGLKIGF